MGHHHLTTATIEQKLLDLESGIARQRGAQMSLLRELDRRQVATRDGHRSLQEWAAGRMDLAPETAKMLVTTALRLEDLPDVDTAVTAGVIGFDRAAAVSRLAGRDNALDLLSEAAGYDIDGIRQLAAKRRRMTRLDEIQAFEERYVSIQPNLDESAWTLSGRLPGFAGRTVVEALETRGDTFPYGQAVTASRTTRNADALWSISHDAVAGGDGASVDTSTPVLTVFVDATEAAPSNGATGVTLEAGPRVGPNAVEAILCTGFTEVTARTKDGKPLALGRRTRVIPPRLRRFILHRDGRRCTVAGCTSRYRLQVHHIDPWSEGGPTDPENLTTLCWFHHQVVIHGQGHRIDPTSPPQRRRLLHPRIHAPPARPRPNAAGRSSRAAEQPSSRAMRGVCLGLSHAVGKTRAPAARPERSGDGSPPGDHHKPERPASVRQTPSTRSQPPNHPVCERGTVSLATRSCSCHYARRVDASYDVIVIGSGFGGSVSALRLTEKGYRVGVLEAGRRYRTGEFAKTNWDLKRFLWGPRLGLYGIQRLDLLSNVLVLSGAGVGGGSLVYANTHYEPHEAFYTDPQWGAITDWKKELAPFYALAKRMLGVVEGTADTPADDVMRAIAKRLNVEDTFRPTPVAVYFGEPGVEADDPYFGGAGPRRAGCTLVGACMVGCNNNAKNTLDKNYLHLAENAGAAIHADTEVTDMEQQSDGRWMITTQTPGPRSGRGRRTFMADQVVFSAGALGTTRLLLKLVEAGRLPGVSDQAGQLVRTNSEVLLGATARGTDIDYSQGVAITSSIHPEPHTHIEPVRYPRGSSAMGLLATMLTDGGPGLPRPMRYLVNMVNHPIRWLKSMSLHRWAERSVILLVMQSYDNSLRLIRKRGIFGTRVVSRQGHGEPNPTYIPIANEAARIAAEAMGGDAMSSINEVLLNRPTTAHILGGAAIGEDASSGVIDAYHRVFGHPGLHVVDGAAVGANLGVNPSLSITAMAERAIALWPNKGDADPRPAISEPYQHLPAVPPKAPAVDPALLGIDVWT